MRGRTDLALVVALALLAVALAALLPSGLLVLRVPAGLALALVLPGYALAAAVFPARELSPAERALLALSLSVVSTIVVTIALDAAGVRLTLTAWALALGVVTVLGAAVGAGRGHARALRAPGLRVRTGEALVLAIAALLLGGAAGLGFTPLSAPPGTEGTVALNIVPCAGRGAVEVGVISDELSKQRYSVVVALRRQRLHARLGPITLEPGGSWSAVVATGRRGVAVVATLRRAADPHAAYRTVDLNRWSTVPAARCSTARSVSLRP